VEVIGPGRIVGVVLHGKNRNGIFNANDTGMAQLTVVLRANDARLTLVGWPSYWGTSLA